MVSSVEHSRPHDRHSRLRPFAAWMKRLTALKPSQDASTAHGSRKHHASSPSQASTTAGQTLNNPYPLSGTVQPHQPRQQSRESSIITFARGDSISYTDDRRSVDSQSMRYGHGAKSIAPTVSTHAGTVISEYPESSKAYSVGGITTNTAAGAVSSIGGGGHGSTFSSPAPSVRSLTTTLTTIHSTAPSTVHGQAPASAIPSHVTTQPGHPTTYATATANNLLTDNASILTLASSTRRRRRRSMDTDASVRALAPSSLWGGSRESLPLSVLSGNPGGDSASIIGASSSAAPLPTRGSIAEAAAERASVYSVPGTIAVLANERTSYHGVRTADGISVKSGIMSHSRNDSVSGAARDVASRSGRRGSDWAEVEEEDHDEGVADLDPTPSEKGKANAI